MRTAALHDDLAGNLSELVMFAKYYVRSHIARSFCSAMSQQQQLTGASHQQTGLARALYIVGTPIGNLEDVTMRAVRILRDASVIMAEDTRHTRKLLTHLNISNSLVSLHSHNEVSRAQEVNTLRSKPLSLRLGCLKEEPADTTVSIVASRCCQDSSRARL